MNDFRLAMFGLLWLSLLYVAIVGSSSEPDLDPQQVAFADHCLKSGMQPQIKGQFVVCKPKQEK